MTKDGPILLVVAAVGCGAVLGAVLRWALSYALNAKWALMPAGTLAANLIGGFLIGAALAFFSEHLSASPLVKLFVVTGFLGGLTTFSTFSAENVAMLMAGDYVRAIAHAGVHLLGSLSMTASGMWLVRSILH